MAHAPLAFAGLFRVELEPGQGAVAVNHVQLPRMPAGRSTESLPPLVLRRAASADRLFHDWWADARSGHSDLRNVTVTLLAPDLTQIFAWRLLKARPLALSYGALDAAADGLLEEVLELTFEAIERA